MQVQKVGQTVLNENLSTKNFLSYPFGKLNLICNNEMVIKFYDIYWYDFYTQFCSKFSW